jgi:integrase
VGSAKLLAVHLEEWASSQTAKDCSKRHVDLLSGRVKRIFNGCGFRFFGDILASKVMTFLDGLRTDTDKKRGISCQTFNFYLAALKQFCRWMVKDRRAAESPVNHLDGLNVRTDRRHDRRALAVPELVRLLDAAYRGPVRFTMSGPDRALLYKLGVETGLRAGELRSLTRASFDIDGDNPTVTVEAEYSKRRREDTLPLRRALVAELRNLLAMLAPTAVAFPTMPERQHVAEMFKADLEAGGIPYVDADGLFADFHCLRHTFISNLARGGIHPKVAQALARHSTITLTMDRYSHTLVEEQSAALAVLPDLSGAGQEAVRATGTDDARGGQKNLAFRLALSGGFQGASLHFDGSSAGEPADSGSGVLPVENAVSSGKSSGEGGIRTLGRIAPTPVFETGPIGRSGTSPNGFRH